MKNLVLGWPILEPTRFFELDRYAYYIAAMAELCANKIDANKEDVIAGWRMGFYDNLTVKKRHHESVDMVQVTMDYLETIIRLFCAKVNSQKGEQYLEEFLNEVELLREMLEQFFKKENNCAGQSRHSIRKPKPAKVSPLVGMGIWNSAEKAKMLQEIRSFSAPPVFVH